MWSSQTFREPRKSELQKDLQTIENALRPIIQEATLPSTSSKHSSHKTVHAWVRALVDSTELFTTSSALIFKDKSNLSPEVVLELEHLKVASSNAIVASNKFANDPSSSEKRVDLVKYARDLLSSVARVMAMADMLDANKKAQMQNDIEKDLAMIQCATSSQELLDYFKMYGLSCKQLIDSASQAIAVFYYKILINQLIFIT